MNQSNLIFGCLFLAFIVYITMKGELPKYLQALVGTNQAASSSNSNSNRGSGSSGGSTSSGGPSGQDQSIAGGGIGGVISSIDRATQIPGISSLGPAALGQNMLQGFEAGGFY